MARCSAKASALVSHHNDYTLLDKLALAGIADIAANGNDSPLLNEIEPIMLEDADLNLTARSTRRNVGHAALPADLYTDPQ